MRRRSGIDAARETAGCGAVHVEIGGAVVIEQAVDRHLEVRPGDNLAGDQVVLIVVGADCPRSVTEKCRQLVAVVVRVATFGVQEDRSRWL